jgi:xanthine dehydrogenase YagT iron-sulfur-binding subunit
MEAQFKRIPSKFVSFSLNVNGKDFNLNLPARTTLAEALRNNLGLTGTKIGCNRAMCGSCTVIMDNRPIFACTVLAVEALNKKIETIEGLEIGEKLHPIQDAFIEFDAVQCGICIPGMVMSAKALLDNNLDPTESEIKTAVSGNLCRCGTYPNTVKAVIAAARHLRNLRAGGNDL